MTLAIPLEQADDGFAVGREIGGASVRKTQPDPGQESRPDELGDRVEPLRRPLEPPAPKHDREGAVRQWSGLDAGAASKSRSTRDARRRLRRVACVEKCATVCATPFSSIVKSACRRSVTGSPLASTARTSIGTSTTRLRIAPGTCVGGGCCARTRGANSMETRQAAFITPAPSEPCEPREPLNPLNPLNP